ncbi:MAG: TetR/AcrR family transcriptional regulator [Sedimentisphaerales bacterium]|nr:TetR/AcrR family transcriptional regulator [Sedimentisphaerales bacterium]
MTAEKITTRQKIIAAAKNLFSTHGYSQTTIDDIITAAGVTKGAFYHYFKSKEIICGEIIDSIQDEYHNIFESLSSKLDPLEKLKTLIKQILHLNNTGQWVNCRLMLRLSGRAQLMQTPIEQKLDDFWKWYTGQFNQLITQCRQLNLTSDKLSAQQQVDIITSILIGNIWTKVIFDSSLDEEIVDYIIEKL